MLDQQRVLNALDAKRSAFADYAAGLSQQSARFDDWVARVGDLSVEEIHARLDALPDGQHPGALPTAEFDAAASLLHLPFGVAWTDHQAARAWARTVLEGCTTIAVDGSQITPAPEFVPPVGAIQVGWFINPHRADTAYVKDLEFDVLAPGDLRDTSGEGDDSYAVQTVNQERFVRECRRLEQLMGDYRRLPLAERPVCFFDGSFIISFAGKISPNRAEPYIDAIRSLLEASEQFEVPLIGFVDNSRSRDVVTMLGHVLGETAIPDANDGDLLNPLLQAWGDRSPFLICARHDALSVAGKAGFYRNVAFCYMRLTQERPPARVEVPRWMVENGVAAAAMDILRAECVVGAGYPYAIETADALAVISARDRERFYALFQQFAQQAAIEFRQARKAYSKVQRR